MFDRKEKISVETAGSNPCSKRCDPCPPPPGLKKEAPTPAPEWPPHSLLQPPFPPSSRLWQSSHSGFLHPKMRLCSSPHTTTHPGNHQGWPDFIPAGARQAPTLDRTPFYGKALIHTTLTLTGIIHTCQRTTQGQL